MLPQNRPKSVKVVSILALVVLWAGCQPSPPPSATPLSRPSPTPQLSPQAQPSPSAGITLTLWVPPEMISSEILESFAAAFPQISVDLVPKKPYGVGGVLDFLLTTQAVVPQNLPDLVLIDASQLYPLVERGMLAPAAELVPGGVLADLYPPAVAAATIDGEVYGIGVLLSLEHLAYDPGVLSSPPGDWEGTLAENRLWALPLQPEDGEVADAFLLQYSALGGLVRDRQGNPSLNQALLARTLQFFSELQAQGLLPEQSLERDSAETWQSLLSGEVSWAGVTSREILATPQAELAFAPLPSGLGNPVSITRVWALAILASNPAHREAASQFIEWLMAEEQLANWAASTGWLPARRSALEMSVAEGPYLEFLAAQLETAYTRPALTVEIAQALQKSLEEVLSGVATPQDAARTALESLGIDE